MNFDAGIDWREALLLAVGLLAVYIAVVFYRFRRLRGSWLGRADERPEGWRESPRAVADARYLEAVEREVAQLRDELTAVRGEFAALRDELRHQVAQVRASQSASPLYSDAMQMAARGCDAGQIAERCGLSRAEADLVVALAQKRDAG